MNEYVCYRQAEIRIAKRAYTRKQTPRQRLRGRTGLFIHTSLIRIFITHEINQRNKRIMTQMLKIKTTRQEEKSKT